MGCCGGGKKGEQELASARIDQQLREDKKRLDREVKLLLLGAGESGKSTIAKQMKIIHLKGFTEEERRSYRSTIFSNIITSMRTLIDAAEELGIAIQATDAAKRVRETTSTSVLTPDLARDIKTLWKDNGIQQTFSQSSKFQLIDSAKYYFDNIDRISAENYSPTEQDVLRSRAKTTGIIEIEFDWDRVHFKLVDVGGQRSERKKWMHCFEDVTAVIFCVAMSEYDLKCVEDDTTNRMHESLRLFEEIANNKWLANTNMILFLNKKDLFEEKIKRVDLSICFDDYTGGKDYNAAAQFIEDKFVSKNQNSNRMIYTHRTCATDTENITTVFNASKDIILRRALAEAGF